jgi:hypothetical protein
MDKGKKYSWSFCRKLFDGGSLARSPDGKVRVCIDCARACIRVLEGDAKEVRVRADRCTDLSEVFRE